MRQLITTLFLVILMEMNVMGEVKHEVAILGGGCFWCLEAVYQKVKGVEKVESGYSGGFIKNPAYGEVTTGSTGHAEVVKVTFNPEVVSYEILLSIFFTIHDPTTLNRQGADVGTQYRSVIFYGSGEQKEVAQKVMDRLAVEEVYDAPIVTRLEAKGPFYPAEAYHDDYYNRNRQQPYCQVVISPKMNKFRNHFKEWLTE
ncbi:peptide-methionine (S)-S-oxide reductase MsrA [Geofilum sp. OHC36d9]|uniref:peptide-methionine (S)-S-oxide reductase MsrA n=1 Tax=Geofilum sp. OHC36d9 TaxID=3458413 RepID=UPI0040336326